MTLAGLPHGVLAQATPQLSAIATEEAPTIDGRLDDPAWVGAEPNDAFVQVNPIEGGEPTERTEMRVLFDRDTLFIGVRCFDDDPSGIRATQMLRDASLGADDRIAFVLDTFASKRNGYFFEVGAAGARRDGLIENGRRPNIDWDGIWSAKTTIDDEGWTAEIAIPFTTVSFDPSTTAWGFNLQRVVIRKDETIRWASPTRNTNVRSLGSAGQVLGLTGMRQGIGLTLKPAITGEYDPDDGGFEARPSFDIFYNPVPSITIAGTLNTDFAEAEVDQRRVNLTRFPLFFPEKRDFFLQDANAFNFGGINRSPLPFFSRRIGIVDGEEQEILGGVKITGRQGNARFGFLDVQMKRTDDLGSKNLGVARARFDVLEESSVGFIVTNGNPSVRGNNTLVGLDFAYIDTASSDQTVEAYAWAMGTRSDTSGETDENDDPYAFGGRLSFPNEPWRFSIFAAQIGPDFNPALGFVQRRGRREFVGDVRYRWRPEETDHPIRFVDLESSFSMFTLFDNRIETARVTIPELSLRTADRYSASAEMFLTRELLTEPFEIVDDVIIPTDTYDNVGGRVSFSTPSNEPVQFSGNASYEGFYSGTRLDLEGTITWRASRSFFASVEYEQNKIDLDEGDFTVHIVRARADVLFTPDISWTNLVQWDNQSDSLGINSRFRWEFEPGNELFLVYNESLGTDDGTFTSEDREVDVKVGVSLRF